MSFKEYVVFNDSSLIWAEEHMCIVWVYGNVINIKLELERFLKYS